MNETVDRQELTITGMSCSHCVAAVRGALASVPGVTGASVDLTTGRATVRGVADTGALVAAVEEQGYGAAPVAG